MIPLLGVWYVTLMSVLFVLVCLLLTFVVLIQKPRGGGLAGAFGGGAMSAQAAFGAKTGDVLTWFTVSLFICFILLAMGLTWTVKPEDGAPTGISSTPVETAAETANSPAAPAENPVLETTTTVVEPPAPAPAASSDTSAPAAPAAPVAPAAPATDAATGAATGGGE